jgi:hypothetical protein
VSTSTPAALGQVFVVHNDAGGVAIAQFDENTGNLVPDKDVSIPAAAGFTVDSSPLITAPDSSGGRVLFFIGHKDTTTGVLDQLFRVPISNAGSTVATLGSVATTGDINATNDASPALVNLKNGAGVTTTYVALGTSDGRLLTFGVADLAAGPATATLSDPVRTPTVPVGTDGLPPTLTPVIYIAAANAATTKVYKVTQAGSASVLDTVAGPVLAGEASPAMATSQVVAKNGPTDGRVVVSTGSNLYSLRTTDLNVVSKLNANDSLVAGSTGFRFTTAVLTGRLVFVTDDSGKEYTLDDVGLQPVDGEFFSADKSSAGSISAFGQPSVANRLLQYASSKGIFVYRLRLASPPTGYWEVATDGGLFSYGDAGFFGSTGDMTLNKPIVGMTPTPDRTGYWMVASDGGIFAFGKAGFFGSTGDIVLNQPIVAMAETPSGLGYWLLAADGGIFAFGDATFFGSTGNVVLNKPIVGMAVTPTGQGYWLVASDGGIFAFGDAEQRFFGSTGDIVLNKPIVGMAALPNGRGYWIVASDGGIFAFGKAGFLGSTGDLTLVSPVVGIAPSATGEGYLLVASDGGLFAFGDVPFFGAAAELGKLNKPVVGLAVKP